MRELLDDTSVELEFHLQLMREYEQKKRDNEAEEARRRLIDSQVYVDLEGTDSLFAPTDDLSELARSVRHKKNRRSKRDEKYQSMTRSELKRSKTNNQVKTSQDSPPTNMEYLDTEEFMQRDQKLTPSTDTYMAGSNEDVTESNEKFQKGISIYTEGTI